MSSLDSLRQSRQPQASSSRSPAQIATIADETESEIDSRTLEGGDSVWLVEYLDKACLYIISAPPMLNFGVAS